MERDPGMPPAPGDQAFAARVERSVRRRLIGQSQAGHAVWSGLGMAGLVGWSVAVPCVLGTMLGIWLDHHHPGRHSWTITLLVIGVALGCANAWHWLSQQSRLIAEQEPPSP